MKGHRIPPVTIELGIALELVTEEGDLHTLWNEVDGWRVLVSPDAFDQSRPRLFIVPGDLEEMEDADAGRAHARAQDAYARWHERAPDAGRVGWLETPDRIGTPIGRAVRLDYASDKWGGEVVEYTHSFKEDGQLAPLAYVHNRNDPQGFALVGGEMTITEQGIG